MSNSTPGFNPGGGGDGGDFAFDFVASSGHQGSGGGKSPQEMGSGSSPPSWWRGLERGAGEVDHEAEVGGGAGPGAFGEELEVFSSALRKDFELKVRAWVNS